LPLLQLGIAGRLAISFVAVAVLAVIANLIVEGKVVLRTTEIRREGVTPIASPPAPASPVVQTVAPAAAGRPAFPSAEPLKRAIDRLERAVDASAEGDVTELTARYQKLAAELDHAAADFASAATAAGESPPVRFMVTVRSYRQGGADLIKLTAVRRASMADYSLHFEQLNARVKKSLDHAWSIFGRVLARQSLVKLANDLDDLRRRYVEFASADTVDSSTFDTLGASEGAFAQTLTQGRAGFTRSDGQDWYTKSQDDLTAMSAARKALLQIDRQRKDGARRFGDDSAALSEIVGRMGKTETYDARQSAVLIAGKRSAVLLSGSPTRVPRAAAQDLIAAVGGQSASAEPQNHSRKLLVAWLSSGVLLLVVYISAGTTLSIVRPVRRLMSATARIANGESGVMVPRGGIRELDTLVLAFNDMAAQLAVAQEAARGQQHLLEAKVSERTLQLQELAQLDPLTRLANRRHFFTLLNAAIEAATRENRLVGVFFLDIDNFKNMNDSLGHEFGDHVLQTIAKRLSESTHSFGFAARLGGDEFTVVYESASSIDDIRLAGLQLVNAFQEPMPLDGREMVVSVSAGASIFPDHATNAEALLRAADAALFEAKALGRSQLALFTPALLEAATARFTTEQGLRRALERGEFELVFQPEVNLQTCEVELVEALLRWRHPDGRYLAPGEFLAVAEASGLILQINDWVLRRVVETAARWHHGHWPDVRVAMNVSSRQLFDNSFVEQVQALLEEHKLPPRCIEIELTESVLQTGIATIASLRRLRAHGIAIALDDFGTGFSSLASLEQLPLTRIKLDRSLVASIDTSARSASIAKAIIHLCQGLGLSVTAEGIERPAQLAPLVGYPAVYAQGYLLAHPQSVDELLPVMAKLPALTRALVRASIARLPESQLAENLPFVTSAIKH
jgi:diguanylate cyclase (GGDEF)-like protein